MRGWKTTAARRTRRVSTACPLHLESNRTMPEVFVSRRVIGLEPYVERLNLDIWEGQMPPSRQELIARTQGKDGLVSLLTDKLDAEFFDAVPGLKVVSQYAVGVNNIDLAAARARGIPVGHTPGVLTDSTADMAFTLLIAPARQFVPGAAHGQQSRWKNARPHILLGEPRHGPTLR